MANHLKTYSIGVLLHICYPIIQYIRLQHNIDTSLENEKYIILSDIHKIACYIKIET